MSKTITTFNALRKVKDMLPSGSMSKIGDELNLDADTVRAYFSGKPVDGLGIHLEPGPDGGIVSIDDTRILEVALRIAWENGAF